MVKLVDTPDLGSGAEMCGGSSPSTRKFIFLTNRISTTIQITLQAFFLEKNYFQSHF